MTCSICTGSTSTSSGVGLSSTRSAMPSCRASTSAKCSASRTSVAEIDPFARQLAMPDEVTDAAQHRGRAQAPARRSSSMISSSASGRASPRAQAARAAAGVAHDGGQRLVDLVRETGRHAAERREPRGARQLRLMLAGAHLRFRLLGAAPLAVIARTVAGGVQRDHGAHHDGDGHRRGGLQAADRVRVPQDRQRGDHLQRELRPGTPRQERGGAEREHEQQDGRGGGVTDDDARERRRDAEHADDRERDDDHVHGARRETDHRQAAEHHDELERGERIEPSLLRGVHHRIAQAEDGDAEKAQQQSGTQTPREQVSRVVHAPIFRVARGRRGDKPQRFRDRRPPAGAESPGGPAGDSVAGSFPSGSGRGQDAPPRRGSAPVRPRPSLRRQSASRRSPA